MVLLMLMQLLIVCNGIVVVVRYLSGSWLLIVCHGRRAFHTDFHLIGRSVVVVTMCRLCLVVMLLTMRILLLLLLKRVVLLLLVMVLIMHVTVVAGHRSSTPLALFMLFLVFTRGHDVILQ